MRTRFDFVPRGPYRRPGMFLVALPLLLLVAVSVIDVYLPADIHLGPLLVVAPALTAATAGPRWTAVTGALAVLALVAVGLARGVLYTENLAVQIGALVLLSALLVGFCVARERNDDRLARVRAVAEATQRVLLRPLPRRVGSLAIASRYRAAEEEARIGGDLYAIARTLGATRLIIGDVSGRGLASINDTAMLLGAFRAAAHRHAPLPDLMAYLEGSVRWGLNESPADQSDSVDEGANRAVAGRDPGGVVEDPGEEAGEDIGQDVGERFVTAVVVEIPDDEPFIRLVNCGHPPPLVLRDGRAGALASPEPAPPLGFGALLKVGYQVTTHPFVEGDVLLLYTDGLSEARDRDGVFYPLAARAPAWSAVGPEALLTGIASDLLAYTGRPLDDDIAMIAVERTARAVPTPTG